MKETMYDVVLHTGIGNRKGSACVIRNGQELSGSLKLLLHEEPFTGFVDKEGLCRIKGQITSLIKSVSYAAVGFANGENLYFKLTCGRHTYEITGTASGSKEVLHEEILSGSH